MITAIRNANAVIDGTVYDDYYRGTSDVWNRKEMIETTALVLGLDRWKRIVLGINEENTETAVYVLYRHG